jgi:hypothetical protein
MAATAGARTARWLLLLCTVIGLTAMHTLGHTGMAAHDQHPAAATTSLMTAAEAATSLTAAPVCTGGHCPGQGMPGGWSVCLAILTGLAVAVLLAVALFAAASRVAALGTPLVPLRLLPRAPPGRPPSLTGLATTVLRI